MTAGRAIVVGAGVVGCSIAFELSRSGRDVVVLDKGRAAGGGSTSSSSAIVRFNYSSLAGVVTSWEAAARWRRWPDHLGVVDPAGMATFHRIGKVVVEAAGSDPSSTFALFDAVGVPYEIWDGATLRARIPAMDPGRYGPPRSPDDPRFWEPAKGDAAAYYMPDAGFVDDPQLAAHNLMVAARHHGADFRFRTEVVGVDRGGAGVKAVTLADGSVLPADIVVNAAGPWSARLNTLAGVLDDFAVGTRPMRQEVHVVDAPAGFRFGAGEGAVCADPDLGTYFRPQPGDTIIVGGVEPECDPLQWIDDPDGYADQPTVEVWRAQTLRLARRLPGVTLPNRPRGLAALYDVTPDWVPIYDRTSLDGYYVAIGTSGNQFKNAPVIGELLRCVIDEVEGGRDHDRDPVHVDFGRGLPVIDMAHYSRLRRPLPTSRSVLG